MRYTAESYINVTGKVCFQIDLHDDASISVDDPRIAQLLVDALNYYGEPKLVAALDIAKRVMSSDLEFKAPARKEHHA